MTDGLSRLKAKYLKAPAFWQSNDAWQVKALKKLSLHYGRYTTWRADRAPMYKAQIPVICIGNFTMGGSGKTPTVQAIAELLQAEGKKPAILLRGYGGSTKGPLLVDITQHGAKLVGDEALLHTHIAPTWVSADRVAGAKAIVAKGDADCIIMDDGAQNPGLHKDFVLQVVDGGFGLGNGRVFPAGPLREDIENGLKRTSAVLMIGSDYTNLLPFMQQRKNLFTGNIIVSENIDHLKGKAWFAFAGIGRPEKFYQTLRKTGLTIVDTQDYPDHHPYTAHDLALLHKTADKQQAQLITTTKDWVRIPTGYQYEVEYLPIALQLDQADVLTRFLLSLWA